MAATTERKRRTVGSNGTNRVPEDTTSNVVIQAPRMRVAAFKIRGTSPLVMHNFSQKSRKEMMDKMAAGSQAKSKKVRTPRDYDDDFEKAKHVSTAGWYGIPAKAFSCAMISSCKIASFVMTRAKISVFIEADGYDVSDGTPLVRMESPNEPERVEHYVRPEKGGTDIRVRPMWREWSVSLRVRWDEDILSAADITNLLMRAGMQVGILEGRADSRKSNGMGWGFFELVQD